MDLNLQNRSSGMKLKFNITNSSQTKLTNNNNSVTHKNTGTLGSATKTWTVGWTAPTTGNMTIDFYS